MENSQVQESIFTPEKNPGEEGKKCKSCLNYWREYFGRHASTGRCKLSPKSRIKASDNACGYFITK